jgi:hypothetical protein
MIYFFRLNIFAGINCNNHRMKLLTTLLIVLTGYTVSAQRVTGQIKDEQGKALSSANVMLHRMKDSSVAKITATNSAGRYEFINIQPGNYFVTVSHVSHTSRISAAFEVSGSGEIAVPEIVLEKSGASLQGVTVTSRKPMVEVKADKTILNVEGTINATGNDALELLRKSPGVLIDKDDNVSLSGKNGVQIYVDGKPTPLSGADLTAYLKNLQSSQIESIEIITNPSAKYDAAGNAGIINIRLKKNKAFGTNGSVNAGYGVGIFPKYNGGLSLNHRNKKVNVFGNYNYNRSRNTGFFKLYREQLDTIFDQRNNFFMNNNSHGFKTGLDYFVSNKSTFGILINGTIADNKNKTESKTFIAYEPTGITDRILTANNTSDAERNNVNFNINYRFADTAGHELNVDADYGIFRINTDQLQPNIYYTPDMMTELSRTIYNFLSPTDIDIYTLKADYEQNFKDGKLGIGFKSSLVNTGNNFGRYNVVGINKTLDTECSNQFDYSENINALYVNFNKAYKKGFMIQAGLRMENTNNTGDSYSLNSNGAVNYSSKQSVKRNYTNLFPSAAVTFNKNPMKQWSLSYSRRIDRPAYQDLNPFEFKLDEYTFQKGNTELRPQYTNSISVTHIYKYKLTATLNYSHVADVFTQLVDTAEKSKSFITKKNLATQDIISLNVSYPFSYKNYNVFGNLNTYYSMYKADFGGGSRIINLDVFSYNLYMQHSLKFGKKKDWTAEVSGFYNAPSIWQGTFESDAIWSIDGGLQKTIFKGKGNIKTSVSDIFKTLKWRGTSNFAGQFLEASGNFESRQFKINLSYRFGSNQVKASRNRKTGTEDESKRVGQGGAGGIQQ